MPKIPAWIQVAGVAVVGYLLYLYLKKQGKDLIVNPLADAIAAPIIAFENAMHETPQTTGSIVLPNGQLIPTSSIQAYVDQPSGQTRVRYNGRIYALASHNSAGNWPATLVG
jgi:hypothetical protein